MEAYRAPYRNRKRRLPTLVWPRELPIEGEPADVIALGEANAKWLIASTNLPKLSLTVTQARVPPDACGGFTERDRGAIRSLSLPRWSSRLG